MASTASEDFDERVRARIPADLDAAEQVMAGLSAGQLLSLGVLTSPLLLVWQTLPGAVPTVVLFTASGAVVALALALVMARRDGLGLDRWLLSALRYRFNPRTMTTSRDLTPAPNSSDASPGETAVAGRRSRRSRRSRQQDGGLAARRGRSATAPLAGVTGEGVLVHADGRHVALIACTTIMTALSTNREEAVLAAGMGRWLNSLAGPVQILVRSRPTDLASRASDVAVAAGQLDNPLLAALALDHAEMLLDVYESERPLQRSVLVACSGGVSTGAEHLTHLVAHMPSLLRARLSSRARTDRPPSAGGVTVSHRAAAEALTRAHRSAGELQALGVSAEVLDGGQVREVLHSSWTPCRLPSRAARPTARLFAGGLEGDYAFASSTHDGLANGADGADDDEAEGEPWDNEWGDRWDEAWPDSTWPQEASHPDDRPWPQEQPQVPRPDGRRQARHNTSQADGVDAAAAASAEPEPEAGTAQGVSTAAHAGRQRLFHPIRPQTDDAARRPQ
ncbi:hypothetical protein Kisp01_70610 [Kineosporia sp. NBRC 101677]|uniref:PrgI family protein n=1 Tax=Kineosporia sp. NBRC 101677 TaxID=3032197 RepID=UPI0024A1971C|nr:PrgI family protein [Kineosporia sp. NBRC 101677]GLY20047.1 hypothetical protein Kisp01_70610 [Kineosporia sp. NBRC 101677]